MPPFSLERNFGCLPLTSSEEEQKTNSLIYENTIHEIYFLTKYANVSYEEVKRMTILEKDHMIKFTHDEMQRNAEKIQEIQESQKR